MLKRLFLPATLLMFVSCQPSGGSGKGDFEAKINTDLAPQQTTTLDANGEETAIAASRDEQGVQSDFVEGIILVHPKSDADLQAFLKRYGGTVVQDDTVPEPPASLGITLSEEQKKATSFAVRIDLSKVDSSTIPENASATGLEGAIEFSSEAGLKTFAGALDAKAAGFDVGNDWMTYGFQVPFPANTVQTLFNSQERITSGAGVAPVTFLDSFAEPHYGSGPNTSNSNVTRAWQYVAAHGFAQRVQVAILDCGFWLDTAGNPRVDPARGNDSDFPASNPIQYDFIGNDRIADGPNTVGCGAGNPCFWHGTGSAGTATGVFNNQLGTAGTGGITADPMLFKIDGTRKTQNLAIRTAIAWGAEVVSMSFGGDCNTSCRSDDRGDGSMSAVYIASAPNVVFLAAAGNGRGTPSAGYDVGDPSFVHPCQIDHVICVGALNDPSPAGATPPLSNPATIQSYSNFGSRVNIFAPTNIPVMSQPVSTNNNPASPAAPLPITFGGTSAATPFVAGVAGLMKALNPSLTGDQVNSILTSTAQPGGDAFVTRIIDAFAAVRQAGDSTTPVPDRFEPNNGPGVTTDLGNLPSYSVSNLSLGGQDRDYFKVVAPPNSQMTITLTFPVALGDINTIGLTSEADSCTSPTQTSNVSNANGRVITYLVPPGPQIFGLTSGNVIAYNMSITFSPATLTADSFEPNNTAPTANAVVRFFEVTAAGDTILLLNKDASFTIDANLDTATDVDWYIARGAARLSSKETALLYGAPFVSIYGNTAPVNLAVFNRNGDGTQGTLVGSVSAQPCAENKFVKLQSDLYYLIRVDGSAGPYTLFNGGLADPTANLPPILVGGFPKKIERPGPVEIDRFLLFPELILFTGDRSISAALTRRPGIHISLQDFNGLRLADGVANGLGERLSLQNLSETQGYALMAEPVDLSAGPPELQLDWESATPTRTSDNLIQNPAAEVPPGTPIPFWDITQSTPTTLLYPTPLTGPVPADHGLYYFAGGPNNAASAIRQVVVIDSSWRAAIDAGRVKCHFSAFFGGYAAEADSASGRLIFRTVDDAVTGQATLRSVTAVDRQNTTGLLPVQTDDFVPAGTGVVLVDVFFTGVTGPYNDGYADSLQLVLSEFAP